jgi:hypothetical protein
MIPADGGQDRPGADVTLLKIAGLGDSELHEHFGG